MILSTSMPHAPLGKEKFLDQNYYDINNCLTIDRKW